MGIRDWFGKDEVLGSKVLVSSLDARFYELAKADAEIYARFYRSTTAIILNSIQELTEAVNRKYDVVHLLCDVQTNGIIADTDRNTVTGTELIQKCCDSNVKLLWIANDNHPDAYIRGFRARGKRLNLVMTISRNDPKFSEFLEKLLFRMFYGETMPVAWEDLCRQIPGSLHPDSPSSIFYAGRGSVKLQ